MFPRSPCARLVTAAVAGGLLTTAAVVPALADEDGRSQHATGTPRITSIDNTTNTNSGSTNTTNTNSGSTNGGKSASDTAGKAVPNAGPPHPAGRSGAGTDTEGTHTGSRFSRARVTAHGGLALHARPDRASRVLRVAREGETMRILCRATGENVYGNHLWYLLADGTWTWGATRFIDNAGPAPRWC